MNNKQETVSIGAYEQVLWERDVAIDQLKQLGYGFGEKINKLSDKQKIGELEDVVASLDCKYYSFIDELCQIIFEGENTKIGRTITIDRIKEFVNYNEWLKEEKI